MFDAGDILAWLQAHVGRLAELAGLSLAVSLGGLWLLRWVIVSLPPDYFVAADAPDAWRHRHPVFRWTWFAVKNLLGTVLLVAGVMMLVAPGPGVLSILIGLSLISVPGKRKLLLRLMRNRTLLVALNVMRSRAGRPPLILPAAHSATD